MFIYTPYRLLAGNLRVACWESLMVAVANIYNIGVGLSALLVSTNRAIQSLYIVERVTDGSTFLFCILSYAFTELSCTDGAEV